MFNNIGFIIPDRVKCSMWQTDSRFDQIYYLLDSTKFAQSVNIANILFTGTY